MRDGIIELIRLREEVKALRAFANDVLDGFPELGTLDGFDLQDLAVKHGLLVGEERTVPCVEHACVCAEYVDHGDQTTCFRFTSILTGNQEKV